MEIIVKLDDMLYARRMTLTELAEKVDITLANLSILKTGKAKAIRFSTLASICEALDCQPGDILTFENGKNRHPELVQVKSPIPIQQAMDTATALAGWACNAGSGWRQGGLGPDKRWPPDNCAASPHIGYGQSAVLTDFFKPFS